MSDGFLYRGVAIFFGVAAILSLLLFLSQFRKNKELIKARLFLMFDRLSRLAILFILFFIVGIGAHIAYISTGADDNFVSAERFFRNGIFALAVYLLAIGVGLVMYFMLRPVPPPRASGKQPPS